MSQVKTTDFNLWAKHIIDNDRLANRIRKMKDGDTVNLEVGGFHSTWRKMKSGAEGLVCVTGPVPIRVIE